MPMPMSPKTLQFRRCVPPSMLAALSLFVAGCAPLGPDFRRPPVSFQPEWTAPAGADAKDDGSWWDQFGDPLLTELLTLARSANPGLQSAAVRIAQAQVQLAITTTGERPGMQLSGGANHTKPDTLSQLVGKTDGSTAVQLGLQSSWEPDFWGKVRRGVESDRAGWLSSIAAYRAAQVSLEASIGSTYFSLRTLEQRVAVAQANLTEQAENLRIAEARFRAGATSELDQRQAQAQFEQTQAQIPALRAGRQQAAHALSFLLGQTPDYYDAKFTAAGGAMPRPPAALALGMPMDLLQRRPDVVQAEMAAASQSARIG